MRDITAITQVGVADGDAYDLNGFESAMAIVTVATAYDASAVKVSAGDDPAALEELPADSMAVVVRFDNEGKTAKVGYIGARRYMSITGGTLVAVILQNPDAAPRGVTEKPEDEAEAATPAARRAAPRTMTAATHTGAVV